MVYEYARVATKEVARRLGGSNGMWVIIVVVVWLLSFLFVWAIVYGGSKNDPNRYEDDPDIPMHPNCRHTIYPFVKEDQEEK